MFKYIDIHMMHVNAKIHTLIIQLYGKDPVINFTQVGSFLKKQTKKLYIYCVFSHLLDQMNGRQKMLMRKDAQKLKTIANTPYRPKSLCQGELTGTKTKSQFTCFERVKINARRFTKIQCLCIDKAFYRYTTRRRLHSRKLLHNDQLHMCPH